MALCMGNICIARSKSEHSSRRLLEAALAIAIFGFLQGLLFVVIVPFMGPIKSDEMAKAIILTLIMISAGMVVGAGLSLVTAYLNERRRQVSS